MQVSTALLCDAASVRDGLLFLLGGGLTRLYRPNVPAAMNVSLALTITLHRQEIGRPHELAVDVIDEDGGRVAEIRGAFQVPAAPPSMGVHEELIVPVVLPFTNVGVPRYGWYSIEVSVDGHHERTAAFRVVPMNEAPGQPPVAPEGT